VSMSTRYGTAPPSRIVVKTSWSLKLWEKKNVQIFWQSYTQKILMKMFAVWTKTYMSPINVSEIACSGKDPFLSQTTKR
jgi:hypothetical protein